MGMPRDSRARGLMGLAVVLLGTTLPCLGAPAADGAKNTPSPGSYRVPRWIEEIGTADQPAAPRMTPLRQTQPFGTAAAPLPGTVPHPLAPVAAKPLTIAATPAADSDGKPGRALLRRHVNRHLVLVLHVAPQNGLRQQRLQRVLYGALHRPRAVDGIVANLGVGGQCTSTEEGRSCVRAHAPRPGTAQPRRSA